MNLIKGVLRSIKRFIVDRRAVFYLRKAKKRKNNPKGIRVGFIAFEPESWDKLQPVYEAMLETPDFQPMLILLPSFDTKLRLSLEYGYEKEYFEKKYRSVVLAYDNNCLINLKEQNLDYVFYQDPYDAHYPKGMKVFDLVKYTKICLVPYGYTLSYNFEGILGNNLFFKNVYFNFADSKTYGRPIEKLCKKNIDKGLQRVLYCGYPALEKYMKWEEDNPDGYITWAPRWSYDSVVGGSHFLEYKDEVISLSEKYLDEKILIRPHPLLFSNMVQIKKMTQGDVESYFTKASEKGVEINDRGAIDDVLRTTKILIADYSSIISSFFSTGRPIIYCESIYKPSEEFKEMLNYIYVAKSWEDVTDYLDEILNGNDYLRDQRIEYINNGPFEIHKNSSKKILDCLRGDGNTG